MNTTPFAAPGTSTGATRPWFWRTTLFYGGVHFLVMSYGAFVIEFFQGGCQWIVPAFFMVLPAMLSILTLRRFWAGTAVFLPYAVIGFGIYLTPLITMTFFYIPQPPESHYHQFTTGIVYSLSWLLVNGGFAGYTAHLWVKGRL